MDERENDVAEQTLNAVVKLRNEVFPWLMILQVVPDEGFKEGKKKEPGQVHVKKYWQ
jgi:hypothetical protein